VSRFQNDAGEAEKDAKRNRHGAANQGEWLTLCQGQERSREMRLSMIHLKAGLLAAAALLISSYAVAQENVIKIGVNEPLTGVAAASGGYVADGARIAADQINAEGGVLGRHLELVIEDSKSNPTAAVEGAQKLIVKDKVPVLMGAWSSTYTLAIMPLLMRYQIPMLVETSSSPKITRSGNPWIFRIAPDSEMQAEAFGKYVDALQLKKAAFLIVNNDWGLGNFNAFSEMLKQHGIVTVQKEVMAPNAQDLSAQLAKIKSSDADSLFIVTEVQQISLILKQAYTLKLPQKIISASASSSPDEIIEEAGATASNGAYSIVAFAPWFPEMWPNPDLAKVLVAEWKKRGLVYAGITEGFRGYDGIRTIVAAINKAGKAEPEAIQKAFWDIQVPGVNNTYSFEKLGPAGSESGQSKANVYIIQMKDGKVINPKLAGG
jgi:branched-chain amino acid transport system substrate-binding protein